MPESSRPISRREFLRLAALGIPAAALLACSNEQLTPARAVEDASGNIDTTPSATSVATPVPRPIPPAGVVERALLPGSEWETRLIATHSGTAGSTVMFLGGVHGNEPGGWLAAEEVATWTPSAGSILVIPRANLVATQAFVRTTEELGDLNRLYPGSPDGPPMARMAAAIIEVAREFGADLLIDMHESWGFFVERTQNGTAFLGQTVTASTGPEAATIVPAIIGLVNPRISVERDLLVTRDQFPLPNATPFSTPPSNDRLGRGSSSLSLGRHVPGLTPVLVEMGQDRQPEYRRVELHLEVARAALEIRGML